MDYIEMLSVDWIMCVCVTNIKNINLERFVNTFSIRFCFDQKRTIKPGRSVSFIVSSKDLYYPKIYIYTK